MRTGVRVKLLCPVLFHGQSRDDNSGNAGETEPVFALDVLKKFEHVVSDAKVDVELDERSTVEARVNRESRAFLWRLIEFGHRLADLKREEVRDDEEVGGHDLGDVIREKRAPRLGGRAPTPHHGLRDSRLADRDSELEEFAVNSWGAPQRVVTEGQESQLGLPAQILFIESQLPRIGAISGNVRVNDKGRTPEGIRPTIAILLVGATGFEPATPCAQAVNIAFSGVFLQPPICS